MKLIDADMLLENYEHIKQLLIQKYGEKEALSGLHFSLNDCINNIQNQPEVKPKKRVTLFDGVKTADRIELAHFLCELVSQSSQGCGTCPASSKCHYGHTGMLDWLETEINENYEINQVLEDYVTE